MATYDVWGQGMRSLTADFSPSVEQVSIEIRWYLENVELFMMRPTLKESTVEQCLHLRHINASREFPDEIVKLVTHLATKLIRESLHRSAINAMDGRSEKVTIDNLHKIVPQIILDFDL